MSTQIIIKGHYALKTAFVTLLEGMGCKPIGPSTRQSITTVDSNVDIHVSEERKKYSAVKTMSISSDELYSLPGQWDEALKACEAIMKKEPIALEVGYTLPNSKFKVGDQVLVTDSGRCYDGYGAMFKLMGFANQEKNWSSDVDHIKQRPATVFHIMKHLTHIRVLPLLALRYDDGKELLIAEEGVIKFTGFKEGDKVMVEPTDGYYDTVPYAALTTASTYIKPSYTPGMHIIKFSTGGENSYYKLRYATEEEISKAIGDKVFTIGDAATGKVVKVSSKGIKLESGEKLELQHLEEVVKGMHRYKPELGDKYWRMDIPYINIGCTKMITYEQLVAIVRHARLLNVK